MKYTLLLLLFLFYNCDAQNKETMDYKKVTIELFGESHTIKVPKNEVYTPFVYDEIQAAKTIHINLNDAIQNKLPLAELEFLLTIQREYIQKQANNPEFSAMDEANIKFLEETVQSQGIKLSKDELLTIFETEVFYMKLIKIVT